MGKKATIKKDIVPPKLSVKALGIEKITRCAQPVDFEAEYFKDIPIVLEDAVEYLIKLYLQLKIL